MQNWVTALCMHPLNQQIILCIYGLWLRIISNHVTVNYKRTNKALIKFAARIINTQRGNGQNGVLAPFPLIEGTLGTRRVRIIRLVWIAIWVECRRDYSNVEIEIRSLPARSPHIWVSVLLVHGLYKALVLSVWLVLTHYQYLLHLQSLFSKS